MAEKVENMQTLSFQTEAKQLLHLMIHSLYSNKEVFLRELISNASDALDKLRFEAASDASIKSPDEYKVEIKLNKKAKTITIIDNGIGMSEEEVKENIGTIARSGSKAFLEKLSGDKKADASLIGQFGVGFYSAFMVASRVKLVSKRAGSDQPATVWESSGEDSYAIGASDERLEPGTSITLYLRDDESEYCEDYRVRAIIKKYSDFIGFPIYMDNDKGKAEVVNETKPLWMRPSSELNDDTYDTFYKQVLSGFGETLSVLHNKVEGITEYTNLLFIPKKAPFDLFNSDRKHGVRLYVKRVFIMDDCKELLPEYLRFIKGVVDSEDLPLNVSREILQHNQTIDKIRKSLVGKLLGELKKISEKDPSAYTEFWKEFGPVIKEGLHSDFENKDKLLEIARFQSTHGATDSELCSLKQYVSRMRDDQKHIYYITGESRALVEKSPHLEIFKEKGIEVLFLVDPIDEFIIPSIYNFDGKELKSITKGDLDLGDLDKEDKKELEKSKTKFKNLSERIKNILSDSVKEVRITNRLKESPCCLVADEADMGANMEKLMKAMGQTYTPSKRILELNNSHPIITNMQSLYEKEPKSQKLSEWAELLFDQALIAEGNLPRDALSYTNRVNQLLSSATAQSIE